MTPSGLTMGIILKIKALVKNSKSEFLIKDSIMPYTQYELDISDGWTRDVITIYGLFLSL